MLTEQPAGMIGHTALAEALARTGALGDTSEFHGTLCGLYCGMPDAGPHAWLERSLAAADADTLPPADSRAVLEEVARDVHAALTSDELAFEPVLPDDERPLAERAPALARWCEGFLYGLAVGDAAGMRALNGDAAEALADFARIARTADAAGAGEADESAYAELVEYVRVGVQLVFEELQRRRGQR